MKTKLLLKRAYDAPAKDDGYRVLVDRLWPRGLTKDAVHLDEWAKELAPSGELRKWYDHDPAKWKAFKEKYEMELKANDAVQAFVHAHANKEVITLLYAAKDEALSNAVVLKGWLLQHWKK